MGFEQLAERRDRLRAQAEQAKPAKSAQSKAKASPGRAAKKREPVDPEVEAIWRLQRHFPLAFPKNPAPKVPLKQGILEDAQQHLESLGITAEQLKQAIATWCQGNRYWSCMVEDAPRLDLQGQVAGKVTAEQAVYAKRQASRRQRDQMREKRAKRARAATESAADKLESDADAQPDSSAF
ncbi:ProQ activator of osmoprotectant transporter prop [Pseudomonas aeruginosa]|nr:ProQ activator of osmoprotectant transporter prop [Pseudomonas aeruginosa]